MVATYRILSVLVIFALSVLIIRIGSVAFRMTGLSPDVASFQSMSAFSGTGFTTDEAEQVTSTPQRRTVVKALIRLGSIGLVGALASLTLSFTRTNANDAVTLASILGGVGLLILLARSHWLNRVTTPLIERALSGTTDLALTDYTRMLGLQREYRIAEVDVREGDWLSNETAKGMNLSDEGVLLLGIRRGDDYIGAPGSDTGIREGDTIVLYGKEDRLQELADRDEGDVEAHEDAVEEHETDLQDQAKLIDS